MKILPQLCLVGVVAAGLAMASPAHAQKIRTYGDQSSSSSSGGGSSSSGARGGAGWYPGMPQPSSGDDGGQASGQQQAGEQGEEEGQEEGMTATYRVRMYGGTSPGSASGPRTTLDLAIEKMYRGVIPGKRDEVEHLKAKDQTGPNSLTWLGFQPEDERTRVFIQTSREADYEQSVDSEDKTLTLTLYNTKVSAKNFSRFIDTSFFGRNVQLIEAKKANGAVEIMIALDEIERPTVQQDGTYLYLDFPHEAKETSDGESGGQ
ncbi:MAG: AMIN domain-containing protein [Myxococcota bacterium]